MKTFLLLLLLLNPWKKMDLT